MLTGLDGSLAGLRDNYALLGHHLHKDSSAIIETQSMRGG